MNSEGFDFLYAPTFIWFLGIFLKITAVASIILLLDPALKRRPATRHAVLLSGLVLILLIPFTGGMAHLLPTPRLSLSLFQTSINTKAASKTLNRLPIEERVSDSRFSEVTIGANLKNSLSNLQFTESKVGGAEDSLNPQFRQPRQPRHPLQPNDGALPIEFSLDAPSSSDVPAPFAFLSKATTVIFPMVLIVWLLGMFRLITKLIIGSFRLNNILHSASLNCDSSIATTFAMAAESLHVRLLPELLISDQITGPFSAGIFRARVVLPKNIVNHLTQQQLREVFIHELAHMLRRDPVIVLLQRIAGAIYWIHPLIQILNRHLAQAREEVCDNYVLAFSDAPKYSRTLLTLGQLIERRASPLFAAGLFTSSWKLESRVSGLLDHRRSHRTQLSSTGVTCIFLFTVGIFILAALGTISLVAAPSPEGVGDDGNPTHFGGVATTIVTNAGSDASHESPSTIRDSDALPNGAVMRLGTSRFRQNATATKIAYSPDGRILATIDKSSVIIWDAISGRQLKQLSHKTKQHDRAEFSALNFSWDGEEIAAADFSHIYVWDVDAGFELLSFPHNASWIGRPDDIRFSPNGEILAMNHYSDGVYLFDSATGKKLKDLQLDGQKGGTTGICWSPDGTVVSTATLKPAVVTWNVESGEIVGRFDVDKKPLPDNRAYSRNPINSMDGKLILAATGHWVDVWQTATGNHLARIETDAEYITSIALTNDQKRLVIEADECTLYVYDFERNELLRKFDGRLWLARSLAVSPNGKSIALGAVHPTIRQWDIETGEEKYPEFTATGHDAPVKGVAYSPDGQTIVSVGWNKRINIWDSATGRIRANVPSEFGAVRVAFTSNGKHFLTGGGPVSGTIRVRNSETGDEERKIDTGMKSVRTFALSPDEKKIVIVASDSGHDSNSNIHEEELQVWNLLSCERLSAFKIATANTVSAAFALDGTTLILGSGDGMIRALDVDTGHEISVRPGHHHYVNSLAISPDGTLLASGSADQTIGIWETKTWKKLRTLRGHERAVTCVAFSPDGRLLASASTEDSFPVNPKSPHRIRIWNVQTGEQVGAFSGHKSNTSALAFAPNGERLVTGHDNTTLLVWDIRHMDAP